MAREKGGVGTASECRSGRNVWGFLVKLGTAIKRWADYRLNFVTVTTLFLAVCILLTIILGFFLYWGKTVPDVGAVLWSQVKDGSIFETVCRAYRSGRLGDGILYGIQTVFDLLEGEYENLRGGFPNHPYLTWWLCFLVPAMTVITVIVAILRVFPGYIRSRSEYLIFAQAEENSILLAEDMLQDAENGGIRRDRVAIFLRTDGQRLSPECSARLKKIGAKTYPYTEADLLRIHWGLRNKKLRFFFLSRHTELNFSRMKELLKEAGKNSLFTAAPKREREAAEGEERKGIYRQELYLLSETESAPLLIDHLREELHSKQGDTAAEKKRLPVFAHTDLRLLDRYRTVMYDLLQRKPLYEGVQDNHIRILVLGFGRVGKAFFRAAASFGVMAGYQASFEIRDIDMERQWQELLLQYPECDQIKEKNRESMNVESEALTACLDEAQKKGKPYTYILLSLGDDERNIKAACTMARHYRQRQWEDDKTLFPVICVNLEDKIKSDYVAEFFKSMEPENRLYAFGSDNSTFSEKMLIDRKLWFAARMLQTNLKERDFTYWNEYERRSSVACAAHASYHCKAVEAYLTVGEHALYFDRLDGWQQDEMIKAEHMRWVNYSRCEGMKPISRDAAKKMIGKMNTHVDVDARLSPCLIETEELDELYTELYPDAKETNRKLEQEGKRPHRTFRERDRHVARNVFRIREMVQGAENSGGTA